MATRPDNPVLGCVRRVAGHLAAAVVDRLLLERFVQSGDEDTFAALVRRYGPLVLGVCRRALRDSAAEDAFQETFLVLARKARSLHWPEAPGPWLYGVAWRTARKMKRREARHREHERAGPKRVVRRTRSSGTT